MSNISSKNSYPNPLSDYFKMMVDQWYSFVINYNQSYITLTESTYDSLCELFCETMKPMALNMAREYAMRLQEQKEQQSNQYSIPYS
jgi:predicted secreted hydrolase